MGVIWTRRPTKKLNSSSALVGVDKSNPLNAGLVSAFDLGSSLINLADHNPGPTNDAIIVNTTGTGVTQKYDPIMGLVRDFAGEGSDPRLRIARSLVDTPTGKFTFVIAVYIRSTGEGTFGRIIDTGLTVADPGPVGWALYPAASTTALQFNSSGDATVLDSGSDLITGKFNLVVLTYDGTTASIYINGVLSSSGARSAPAVLSSAVSIDVPSIGNRSGSANLTRDFDGQLGPMLFYKRAWSAREVASLGKRPEDIFKLFAKRYEPRFFPSVSNSDVVKSLDVSYNLQNYITKDLATSYSISTGVTKDLAASYTITAYVNKTLTTSYSIDSLVNQVGFPISDIAAGGWTASSGSDLWPMVDDNSNLDYIVNAGAGTAKLLLTSLSDPGVSASYTVEYRIFSNNAATLVVSLRQGTTEIKSWTHSPVPAISTSYSMTLSQEEADLITDHTTLALWFTSS